MLGLRSRAPHASSTVRAPNTYSHAYGYTCETDDSTVRLVVTRDRKVTNGLSSQAEVGSDSKCVQAQPDLVIGETRLDSARLGSRLFRPVLHVPLGDYLLTIQNRVSLRLMCPNPNL